MFLFLLFLGPVRRRLTAPRLGRSSGDRVEAPGVVQAPRSRRRGTALASKRATGPSCRRPPGVGRSVASLATSMQGLPQPEIRSPSSSRLFRSSPPPSVTTTELATALRPRSEPLVEARRAVGEDGRLPPGEGRRQGWVDLGPYYHRSRADFCCASFLRRLPGFFSPPAPPFGFKWRWGGPARCMHHGLARLSCAGRRTRLECGPSGAAAVVAGWERRAQEEDAGWDAVEVWDTGRGPWKRTRSDFPR